MLPKISQQLYMQVASMDNVEAKQEYKSRIADMNDQVIIMEVPIHVETGRLKRLYVGDSLSLYYLTAGGIKNYFNSEVIEIKEGTIPYVAIYKPDLESITKVQRRNYLRVPAELEISVKVSEELQFLGITEDVSGGGLSFICEGKYPIENNQLFQGWLLVSYKSGAVDHAFFKAEIVRVKKLETGRLLAMVRFTDIANADRQKIVRFCFERQFDFRKK